MSKAYKSRNEYPVTLCNQGSYYADYDEGTAMWCVFHTDIRSGFAYSSHATEKDAKDAADHRNAFVQQSSDDGY